MSIITQRFDLNPPVQSQLFPLIRKTPGVEFEATPLLFEGFFCCTGSLICYDHKSFLPGTILLKCKCVSPSSHQPTGLDNKFSPERFVEMKRPVIFRCCELLFFPPSSHFYSEHTVFKKSEKYWQAKRPESSQSGVHQKNNREETWKIQTGEISRHFDALSALPHASATSLITAFDFHYCVTVTSCYSWWTSTTIRHQRRHFGSWAEGGVSLIFVRTLKSCLWATQWAANTPRCFFNQMQWKIMDFCCIIKLICINQICFLSPLTRIRTIFDMFLQIFSVVSQQSTPQRKHVLRILLSDMKWQLLLRAIIETNCTEEHKIFSAFSHRFVKTFTSAGTVGGRGGVKRNWRSLLSS